MSANDIVISGMGGRFPESRNVKEFGNNLYAGVDMVTTSEDRWPDGIYGMCNRMGRISDYNSFNGKYFGIMQQMAEGLKPQAKLLLETTYEAIVDSGINPQQLRGTRTGVYVGISNYSMTEGYPQVIESDSKSETTKELFYVLGNSKSLYANRISYFFDFKGTSLITDTACSASFSAFYLAINDLKLGQIDYTVVGATHMTFEPFMLHMKQEGGLCSPKGSSLVLERF